VGAVGNWKFEVGEDYSPSRNEAVAGMMSVSSNNPMFLRLDTHVAFEWRVRNLVWPADVYSVETDLEARQLVIRTSNKKYFKRFNIEELDTLGLPLEEEAVSFSYANNTLLVQYRKPDVIVDYEKAKAKERKELVATATQEGRLNQGGQGQQGDCKQQ